MSAKKLAIQAAKKALLQDQVEIGFASAQNGGKRCYHDHPPLKLGNGVVYGGAAADPIDECDVYVSLTQDGCGMGFPWMNKVEFVYYVRDHHAPSNFKSFEQMVDWLVLQLIAAKTIYIGCHGGHGRTGTLIAAIAARMGHKDAIAWVRKNYCKKSVESQSQVDFLVKHFGVDDDKPSQQWAPPAKGKGHYLGSTDLYDTVVNGAQTSTYNKHLPAPFNPVIEPVPSKKSIWDDYSAG